MARVSDCILGSRGSDGRKFVVQHRARRRTARTTLAIVTLATLPASSLSCGGGSSDGSTSSAPSLIHLELELGRARVTSAPAPASAREKRAWNFTELTAQWRPISSGTFRGLADVKVEPLVDCIRFSLVEPDGPGQGMLLGGIAVDIPETPLDAWTGLIVRARSHARMAGIGAACNVESRAALPHSFAFFGGDAGTSPVFNDGSVQDYLLPLIVHQDGAESPEAARTLHSIGLLAAAPQAAALDIQSIKLVARGASFLEDSGVRSLTRDSITRSTIFAHAPASLAFRVRVPTSGRLDVGLTCLEGEAITYRATVTSGRGEPKVLSSERIGDAARWQQHSLDLAPWSGEEIELTLEAASATPGAVALWGAPIVSGVSGVSGVSHASDAARRARAKQPNVIFYVIDGGGADLMSVYGYNRRTTPFLERLAKEGVVFEHAHSNSTWTQPSTASFMTSLHHSVLGGLRRGVHSTPVPPKAPTMAELMQRGGYETAVFTSNPNCARVIGLERGVDFMRDVDAENSSRSSPELHDRFWRFRRDYPGHPFWVHFQTTDVHEPNEPPSPFAGLFVTPEDHQRLKGWEHQLFANAGDVFGTTSIAEFYDVALGRAKIDRKSFYNLRRGLYDETMAHQDRELERFVERLKVEGEWEDTLLVIASDHGHPAGTFARFGRGLIEPKPEGWQGALFDSYSTRVPLIFVWPRGIEGGRRFDQPVSMIDVLPTILELTGLPLPGIVQGRSLAPLLQGRELPARPVILDEFRVDEATGQMVGNIEMIDGRWGASLEIGPVVEGVEGADGARGRHAYPAGGRWGAVHPFFKETSRLLLYDLWNDPFAARAVGDEHPELVQHYQKALLEQWQVHQALAVHFHEVGDQTLDPAMLRQLRSLGYTR